MAGRFALPAAQGAGMRVSEWAVLGLAAAGLGYAWSRQRAVLAEPLPKEWLPPRQLTEVS
jgi:hypothetical protein